MSNDLNRSKAVTFPEQIESRAREGIKTRVCAP
jgi:hypothetical protein